MSDPRQEKVWHMVRSAIATLKRARALEFEIEEQRISKCNPDWDDACDFRHDPLGENLENVVERLEEIRG